MINVGIIGAGFIVPHFINGVNEVGGYHLRSIMSIESDREKLEELKNTYNIDTFTTNIDTFLNDDQLDVVYIGCPNSFHYGYAKSALEHGKHVIVEKPFCAYLKEAKELVELARSKKLFIFEAITVHTLPNYVLTKTLLDKLGDIKLVEFNFSQYSSRYDKFKQGVTLPVFNPKLQGGALMDLGVYNIHFATGLFGMPKSLSYHANIEKGIDTSGVLILNYPTFKVVSIAAKNCKAPLSVSIQGDEAYIKSDEASSIYTHFVLQPNKGEGQHFENKEHDCYYYEYKEFARIFNEKDYEAIEKCYKQSLMVVEILEKARKSGGLEF